MLLPLGFMGRERDITLTVIVCLLPTVLTQIIPYGDNTDCYITGFCGSLLDGEGLFSDDNGGRSKSQVIQYMTPEMCHPTQSGLTPKARAGNFTVNTEKSCPLMMANSRYRTADGTCNNAFNRGASGKPLARVLKAQYEDGQGAPRMYAKSGRLLPSPRFVSKLCHPDVRGTSEFTIFLMQFGQLMDHDVISTPLPIEDTRRTIKCCTEDRRYIRHDANPECLPIMFSSERNFVGNCMEFVRSMPIEDSFGNVKTPREHLNVVTSFVDVSPVYGSTEERLREVRAYNGTGYLLNMTYDDYLPDSGSEDCIKEKEGDYCFLAGDERVNEHPGLTVLHHSLARLHNRIAHMLRYMRPFYHDEEVFQKARHIVAAIVQKILYADWLPLVLGQKTMVEKGLAVGPKFGRPTYSSLVDPTATSSFGAAVFRFGHTLIPRTIPFAGNDTLLRELFFKPNVIRGNVESIVEGMSTGLNPDARSQAPDAFIVEEVTNHLFETEEGHGMGFDLIALNLQRGRDHGLPPYNDYRDSCGLHRIKTFNDRALGISQRALAAAYEHPDDIDLFSGAMSEPVPQGALVGETFNCLMADVFHNLKFGDRFFYETKGEKGSFSDAELNEIRKVTLAQVLCQTTAIQKIQPNVFRIPSYGNEKVSCDWLVRQGINLGVFAANW